MHADCEADVEAGRRGRVPVEDEGLVGPGGDVAGGAEAVDEVSRLRADRRLGRVHRGDEVDRRDRTRLDPDGAGERGGRLVAQLVGVDHVGPLDRRAADRGQVALLLGAGGVPVEDRPRERAGRQQPVGAVAGARRLVQNRDGRGLVRQERGQLADVVLGGAATVSVDRVGEIQGAAIGRRRLSRRRARGEHAREDQRSGQPIPRTLHIHGLSAKVIMCLLYRTSRKRLASIFRTPTKTSHSTLFVTRSINREQDYRPL